MLVWRRVLLDDGDMATYIVGTACGDTPLCWYKENGGLFFYSIRALAKVSPIELLPEIPPGIKYPEFGRGVGKISL